MAIKASTADLSSEILLKKLSESEFQEHFLFIFTFEPDQGIPATLEHLLKFLNQRLPREFLEPSEID